MNLCLNCGVENPPSKGVKKRKYCSKKCANKYLHELEKRKHPKYGDPDWKNKTKIAKKEKESRKAELEWCEQNMYTAAQVADMCGWSGIANVHIKTKQLNIKPKEVLWSGRRMFWTLEQAKRIKNEQVNYEQKDNEWLRNYRLEVCKRSKERRARPEVKKKNNARARKRRKSDPAFRLRKQVSAHVARALKRGGGKKCGSVMKHLPFTISELKEHLEAKFTEGMTWENHGEWHIDHIIPQAALPYSSLECPNFAKCWNLQNLQPLWAKDNLSKGSYHEGKRYRY
jgi:hypothetical protein